MSVIISENTSTQYPQYRYATPMLHFRTANRYTHLLFDELVYLCIVWKIVSTDTHVYLNFFINIQQSVFYIVIYWW